MGVALLSARTWITNALLGGLRLYTKFAPFRRGRGFFIRPIEYLKRRGWPEPVMTTSLGVKMKFEPSLLGWTVFEHGEWEPDQTKLILGHLPVGSVVLDVGANTGYYALIAAGAVGSSGHIYAFEIQPELQCILRRNVMHNNIADRVTIVPAGCWSSIGAATIESHGDPGAARIAFSATGNVRVTTIDDYVAEVGVERVDLVIIDVEGADFEVLKGAAGVLKRFSPIVVAEVHHLGAFGGSEEQMCAFMARLGYSARPVNNEFSRDILFTPRQRQAQATSP
jgi:FkbM family methyltransferase